MPENLWKKITDLEQNTSQKDKIQIEYREEFFNLILSLFDLDFKFALKQNAYNIVWKFQKILFVKVYNQLENENAKLNFKNLSQNLSKKYKKNVKVAKINYQNVLYTMLCEWIKIATIFEKNINENSIIFNFFPNFQHLKLIPLSKSNLHKLFSETLDKEISLDDILLIKFISFLHLRIGDIMKYLELDDLSKNLFNKLYIFENYTFCAEDMEYVRNINQMFDKSDKET